LSGCTDNAARAVVTCSFDIESTSVRVLVDGVDMTSLIVGDLSDPAATKSLQFEDDMTNSVGHVLAVAGSAGRAGLTLCAEPADGSVGPSVEWGELDFDDSTWVASVDSTSSSPVADPSIWGTKPYAWFRTSVCIDNPTFDGYIIAAATPGTSQFGSTRAAVCDENNRGDDTVITCLSTGEWSVPTTCSPLPSVICVFTADEEILEVYVQGEIVTDQLTLIDASTPAAGNLNNPSLAKRLEFIESKEGNQVLAFEMVSGTECASGGCQNVAGFILGCQSSNPDSPWNDVFSSVNSFLSYSVTDPANDPASRGDSDWTVVAEEFSEWWLPPVASTVDVGCTDCTDINAGAQHIWASAGETNGLGFRYGWLRTAVCSFAPTFDDYVVDDGESIAFSTRTISCADTHYGTPGPIECLTDGSWQLPVGCTRRPEVTCSFTSDAPLRALYVDGTDLTADVVGDITDTSVVKTVQFFEGLVGGPANLAIAISEGSGFIMSCSSDDVDSSWNYVSTDDVAWIAFSSADSTALDSTDGNGFMWYEYEYTPTAFVAPSVASPLTCAECGVADTIWNTAGELTWFRTAFCVSDVSVTGYVVGSGNSNVGDTRSLTCAENWVGTASSLTCEISGEWSTPTGCRELATVTCSLTASNGVSEVYVSGDAVTVVSDTITFTETESQSQTLALSARYPAVCTSCNTLAYLVLSCSSSDPNSPWNNVATDTPSEWTSFSSASSTAVAVDWFAPEYNDGAWVSPLVATGTADSIWGQDIGGDSFQYSWFRTAVCSADLPEFDGFDMSASSTEQDFRNLFDTRAAACASPNTVEGVTQDATCGSDGAWRFPQGCGQGQPYSEWVLENADVCNRGFYTTRLHGQVLPAFDGYTGPVVSVGRVEMSFSAGTSVTSKYYNFIADPDCTNGNDDPAVPDSCIIQYMTGTDCSDVGTAYFVTATNPYQARKYKSGQAFTTRVNPGLLAEDLIGHAIVVTDRAGAYMACTTIPEPYSTAIDIDDFRGNNAGNVDVGSLDISFGETYTEIQYANLAADSACDSGPNGAVPGSCTVSIQTGFSCDDIWQTAFSDANTFYDTGIFATSPWLDAVYADGNGFIRVEHCYYFEETLGRTLVFFDYNGFAIACENIVPNEYLTQPTFLVENMPAASGYSGAAVDFGAIVLSFEGENVQISYVDLVADTVCANGAAPNPVDNSCSIQIYDSNDCDNLAGGHFYDSALVDFDPWPYAKYEPDLNSGGEVTVHFGYNYADVVGKALVLTDSTAAVMACVILDESIAGTSVASYSTGLPNVIDAATATVPVLSTLLFLIM
jgi:hypothetical protein